MFFEFLRDMINAPIQPFLQVTLHLLSEPIHIGLFSRVWAIMAYMLSLFYALLIMSSGVSLMLSGYDSAKRENAKEWLRNILIMIILVQASFFLYELVINLSAAMTSGMLSLVNQDFFLLSVRNASDLGLTIIFGAVYLIVLIFTSLILTIRYALVAIGVVLVPLGIFFYFIHPLKHYGKLILNILGTAIFVTFFDAIFLIGFSQLAQLPLFANIQAIVLIGAFLFIDILTAILLFFSIAKASLSVYTHVKTGGIKL